MYSTSPDGPIKSYYYMHWSLLFIDIVRDIHKKAQNFATVLLPSFLINIYKHSVHFVGHMQTVQTQPRCFRI